MIFVRLSLHLCRSELLPRMRRLWISGADGREERVPAERQQRGRQPVAGCGSVKRTRARASYQIFQIFMSLQQLPLVQKHCRSCENSQLRPRGKTSTLDFYFCCSKGSVLYKERLCCIKKNVRSFPFLDIELFINTLQLLNFSEMTLYLSSKLNSSTVRLFLQRAVHHKFSRCDK